MRILLSMLLLAGCLAAQDSTKTTNSTKTTAPAKPAKKATASSGIPKDAVPTSPGFYRWTDKDGKVWTYRQSPFGVTRWPADSVDMNRDAAEKSNAVGERTVAVEQGDSIRFEQATPFGKRTWVRKKTELSASEQRIWDQSKKSAGSPAAEKPDAPKADKE